MRGGPGGKDAAELICAFPHPGEPGAGGPRGSSGAVVGDCHDEVLSVPDDLNVNLVGAIPVALVSPDGAKYLWIAIAVLEVALIRVYRQRRVSELAPAQGAGT